MPAHAIFNLHRFSDLICILPHAPFQNRMTKYDTGVGLSEQGMSPGFQNIPEVKIKEERENSELSGSFLIGIKEAGKHQI